MKKVLLLISLLLAPICLNATNFWSPKNPTPGMGGFGNVINNGSGTDNCFSRFDADGQHLQNGGVCSDDSNNVTGPISLGMAGPVNWSSGTAVTAGNYSVQRDSDATNQLHFNVPTGSSMEFSINDVSKIKLTSGAAQFDGYLLFNDVTHVTPLDGFVFSDDSAGKLRTNVPTGEDMRYSVNAVDQLVLDATTADFKDNILKTTGGVSLGPDGFTGCVLGFCGRNNYSETITDFSGGTSWSIDSQYIAIDPTADLDTLGGGTFVTAHDYETFSPNTNTKKLGFITNFYYYTQLMGSGFVDELVNVQNGSIISGTRSAGENVAYLIESGHFGTAGTITDDYTMEFQTPSHGNGGTMTNHYGIFMNDQEYGTNSWAIKTGGGKIEFGSPIGKNSLVYLSDNDVAHGMTTLYPTNVFGVDTAISSTTGGRRIVGLSDADSDALIVEGFVGTDAPSGTVTPIRLRGWKKNGATRQAVGSTDLVFDVDNGATSLMQLNGSGALSVPNGSIQSGNGFSTAGNAFAVDETGAMLTATIETTSFAALAESGGNVSIGGTNAGASANKVLALSNSATAPADSADVAQLYAQDISAGHATLGLFTEQAVATDATLVSTNSLTIFINGAKYKIPLIFVP